MQNVRRMMKVVVKRRKVTKQYVAGDLLWNDEVIGNTLEAGDGCLPRGTVMPLSIELFAHGNGVYGKQDSLIRVGEREEGLPDVLLRSRDVYDRLRNSINQYRHRKGKKKRRKKTGEIMLVIK